MSDLDIVRLSRENRKDLHELYKAVYGATRPHQYFDQKYDTAYTGADHIGYFAYKDKVPVSFYGVVPVVCTIGGQNALAAQSCDTMTHPDFQKQGLFIRLAKLTFELAATNGIHFVFGFPNSNSFPAFVKHLGFDHVGAMNRYTVNLAPSFLNKLKATLFPRVFDQKGTEIANDLITENFDGVKYSEAYLKYKRFNGNMITESDGHTVWVAHHPNMFLGAVALSSVKNMSDPLRVLGQNIGASSLTYMVSDNTEMDKLLSKTYGKETGFPIILKDLSGVFQLRNLRFQLADIDIF